MKTSIMMAVVIALFVSLLISTTQADEAGANSDLLVMESFARHQIVESDIIKITDVKKHQVLFFMGITLLITLISTAVLGVMMGVYGKQVFLAHMISAGFTVTLALGHSVVAIVWFFPF